MSRYRYYRGAAGRRYCYSSAATLRCPHEQGAPPHLVAADDFDPDLVFRRAHARSFHFEDGRCSACGAQPEKLGYLVWVEARLADEVHDRAAAGSSDPDNARASLEMSRAVSERLFGDGYLRVAGSHRTFLLKREAIAWCSEQAAIDKAAAREEARS